MNKLILSNICFDGNFDEFCYILKSYNINNVEIAPTKLYNWNEFNDENIDKIRKIIEKNEIKIYSFQSITYQLNDLNIFSNKQNDLLLHIEKVINIATKLNTKILVFGSLKNRKILNYDLDNEKISINFFRKIGKLCEGKNIYFCIENNSKKYNCNFLNTVKEVGDIVNKINHPNIKMIVDIGNMIMENEDINIIENYINDIYHIHISQPFLNNFINPHKIYSILLNILNKNNYKHKITLEMLIKDKKKELSILKKSISNFINLMT